MRMRSRHIAVVLGCCLSTALGVAQGTPQEFEVVAVRAVPSMSIDEMRRDFVALMPRTTKSLVERPYSTVEALLSEAFDLPPSRIVGPAWLATQQINLKAKMPEGATKLDIPEMLRSALVSRFALSFHKEERVVSTLALSVVNGGTKLRPASESSPLSEHRTVGQATLTMSGTLDELAASIGKKLSEAVLATMHDPALYQISFSVRTRDPADEPHPPGESYMDARTRWYRDGLASIGLKLERKKAPIEVIVIDHMERKPTEN